MSNGRHDHTTPHYEDILLARVYNLAPELVWSKRYDQINESEKVRAQNGTRIIRFYLHISPEEQLEWFRQRPDDPSAHWKISESGYSERELWPHYVEAYEDLLALTSTKRTPWFVIPANHRWFRNLAIPQIVASTMQDRGLQLPPANADIAGIRHKYHAAEAAPRKDDRRKDMGRREVGQPAG